MSDRPGGRTWIASGCSTFAARSTPPDAFSPARSGLGDGTRQQAHCQLHWLLWAPQKGGNITRQTDLIGF